MVEEIKQERPEFINDYYDDVAPEEEEPPGNNGDLDYSQTHLEDFLKSQASR